MSYFFCPLCGDEVIFPLMASHFESKHLDVWKSFEQSHIEKFSEYLYKYYFMSSLEKCKYCGSKTSFISITKGYSSICDLCKVRYLYQKCPECNVYIPFPQLDRHLESFHPEYKSCSDPGSTAYRNKTSQPTYCIVCGKDVNFYSFGFCPLCETCCRCISLMEDNTNIVSVFRSYFGSEEVLNSLLNKLGQEGVERDQKYLDAYYKTRVLNGYPSYFYVKYLRNFIYSICRSCRINFDPSDTLEVKVDSEKFFYTFWIMEAEVAISFIPWHLDPNVTAKSVKVLDNKTIENLEQLRFETHNRVKEMAIKPISIYESEFLKFPSLTLESLKILISKRAGNL